MMAIFGKKPEEEKTPEKTPERTLEKPFEKTFEKTPVAPPSRAGARPAETLFGKNLSIKGNVSGDGDVTILGSFEGEFDIKGKLTVADQARIIGNVKARVISVNGTVQGTLKALDNLKLDQTAKVNGQVITPRISITEGALLDGEVKMSSKLDLKPQPIASGPFAAAQPPDKPGIEEKAKS
jgi:cytoskeletal protein CcmA (bactofilin family)